MSRFQPGLSFVIVAGLLIGLAFPWYGRAQVVAGSAASADLEMMAESPAPRAFQRGSILWVVFLAGSPLAEASIEIEGETRRTDAQGALSWELPPGTHRAALGPGRHEVSIHVREASETQVIVRLGSAESATADFEVSVPQGTNHQVPARIEEAAGKRVRLELVSVQEGRPVAGASVLVSGLQGALTADAQGVLELSLPAGSHSFTVLHSSHQTEVLQDVRINDDPQTAKQVILVQLKPASLELEEFLVVAPKIRGSVSALVEIRRNSTALSDVLSGEQMARSGDSDAGASLRRVTGLTLVGGKYVYVRGMGDRYSAVTLNSLGIPSPEPARRVVPLDLFPASMLESVVVQKSFTPDLPADFGGGLIQLRTKSLPERSFARIGVSSAFGDGGKALTYAGGRTDWLGWDDGTRALPSGIREGLASGRKLHENNPPFFTEGYSAEELASFGSSLKPAYDTFQVSRLLPPGLSLAAGGRETVGEVGVGAAASALHSTSFDSSAWKSFKYDVPAPGQPLALDESAENQGSEAERKLGASLDLGAEWRDAHRLRTGVLFVRHTSDEVRVKEYSRAGDSVSRKRTTTLQWNERELLAGQLGGAHRFRLFSDDVAPIEFEWRAQAARSRRLAPDDREYTYFLRDRGAWELNLDVTGNRRNWSELSELSREGALDLNLPVSLAPFGTLRFKTGILQQVRGRRSDTWRLHLRNRLSAEAPVDLTRSPGEIFSAEHIRRGYFAITNLTESADSYDAFQEISAAYATAEWEPHPQWTVQTGVRHESSHQEVGTFFYFDPAHPTSIAELSTSRLCPAHSVTWKPADRVRARLAYGETLARPEFRELSTAPFIDDESGYETVGNSALQGTVIRNLDHRWEYYPSADESLSAGVFLKRFTHPIEQVFEPSPNPRKTYANAEGAENLGLELESRIGLRRLDRAFRRFTLVSNLSLIRSRIRLGEGTAGIQTSRERPLQGQSPWVANLQLLYDLPKTGTQVTLLYNVVGPRITEVGTAGRPDIYELPVHQVDLVASHRFSSRLQAGFRARNLLDPELRSTQGGETVRTLRKGRSFHVSLSTAL